MHIYKGTQQKSMAKRALKAKAPPGQFTALEALNMLKEILSEYGQNISCISGVD